MTKNYHLHVVATAEQVAAVLATGARVTMAALGNGDTLAEVSATNATKATKRKRTTKAASGQTMSEIVLGHFKANPKKTVRVKEIAALVKRHKFRSSGHTAIHNLSKTHPNAVRKIATGMFQLAQ